jgi:hypothetical protein
MWRPTIRVGCCDVRCARRNRHASQFPMGRYYVAEVTGPKAIMTTIPEPMGRHTTEVLSLENKKLNLELESAFF